MLQLLPGAVARTDDLRALRSIGIITYQVIQACDAITKLRNNPPGKTNLGEPQSQIQLQVLNHQCLCGRKISAMPEGIMNKSAIYTREVHGQ